MILSNYQLQEIPVVIIGSNSGIGKALIETLLNGGALVYGLDVQKESQIPIHKNYTYYCANPLDIDALEPIAKHIGENDGALQALVNLSGTITQFKPISELSFEAWNETYDISFKSCFNSCKVFTPLLQKARAAAIVNMSSGLAFIGQKNYGPYSAAKAAVVSFSKTLAAEVAPDIRVNTVAPGAVDTNFIYKEDGSTRFDKEQYKKIVPLGSLGTPDEIASVILFLLSDAASHMTGQCLHINGGAGMH